MIRYTLKCPSDHQFESWFASADAYDSLTSSGRVACPECGETGISKSLMSPGVRPARGRAPDASSPETRPTRPEAPLVDPKLAAFRRHVEANSDYVGRDFASQARQMHEGDIPHRSIYGEAKFDDARQLVEDGIPVAPLPFSPTRKTN